MVKMVISCDVCGKNLPEPEMFSVEIRLGYTFNVVAEAHLCAECAGSIVRGFKMRKTAFGEGCLAKMLEKEGERK